MTQGFERRLHWDYEVQNRMDRKPLTPCVNNGKEYRPSIGSQHQVEFRSNVTVMVTAFVIGIGLMGMKFLGYWLTSSSAILSDALESIINVVASGFGLGSVIVSAKPADDSHPYGHGKIEFFAAGFEGALIIGAAVGIFF